ncbi:sigma-70 family RNA polymerase sigma factor [Paenibacillus dendritiformis]|uniref:RNA polymerase ECF-type sigma factor n=1 Tax=Paenibacillus dendritiformis C454 TaxID=1131935 RepID=H3SNR7_9BACL|nr:sigma-70 family RNA polymerase sigma factor [Paenibacillus dendritiformis]EHQ59286.1 RNA polymerase ECF-type sigma factor [Paenibacillus dendritiformis C454]CAH8773168.1 sigma-70 family RNA polymerase sigma factor [Paenibacillus dendritiformis]
MDVHKEYILKAQAGDSEAFIHLMQEMELPLYRMALLMVKQEADCADAIQETMLKAYKSIHSLREPEFFKTWLYRILINECNKILKKRSQAVTIEECPYPSANSMEYDKIDLHEAVDRLDENLRVVIVLHYFHDLPIHQIADVLDISAGAVKTRLHRARKTLLSWLSNNPEGEMNCGTL